MVPSQGGRFQSIVPLTFTANICWEQCALALAHVLYGLFLLIVRAAPQESMTRTKLLGSGFQLICLLAA